MTRHVGSAAPAARATSSVRPELHDGRPAPSRTYEIFARVGGIRYWLAGRFASE